MEAEVEEYATRGKVILCGDLNARTGNCNDVIPYDSDLPIRSFFRYIVDSAIPRTSKYTTVNAQGRYLLDLCISSRRIIVNGRLDGDRHGNYTCYTPRRCSVLVSADILQEVMYFNEVDQDNVNASAKKVETLLKTIIKRAGGAST